MCWKNNIFSFREKTGKKQLQHKGKLKTNAEEKYLFQHIKTEKYEDFLHDVLLKRSGTCMTQIYQLCRSFILMKRRLALDYCVAAMNNFCVCLFIRKEKKENCPAEIQKRKASRAESLACSLAESACSVPRYHPGR